MASPFKPLDTEDLAILQGMVDEYYQRFCQVVDDARDHLDIDQVKALADGRVYTGAQAKDKGLVDALGSLDCAIAIAKKASGCQRVKVVIYHRPLGYRANVYSLAGTTAAPQVSLFNFSFDDLLAAAEPKFLYLWTGHTYE